MQAEGLRGFSFLVLLLLRSHSAGAAPLQPQGCRAPALALAADCPAGQPPGFEVSSSAVPEALPGGSPGHSTPPLVPTAAGVHSLQPLLTRTPLHSTPTPPLPTSASPSLHSWMQ